MANRLIVSSVVIVLLAIGGSVPRVEASALDPITPQRAVHGALLASMPSSCAPRPEPPKPCLLVRALAPVVGVLDSSYHVLGGIAAIPFCGMDKLVERCCPLLKPFSCPSEPPARPAPPRRPRCPKGPPVPCPVL